MPDSKDARRFRVPPNACDCHMHVFGPPDAYPLASDRNYTPRPASLDPYRSLAAGFGLDRFVLVQPSPYGTDNRCLLDNLRTVRTRARGIVVIDRTTDDEQLKAMDRLGVCGVRINVANRAVKDPASVGAIIAETARRIQHLGWHIELLAGVATWRALVPAINAAEVPIVLDHLGMVSSDAGPEPPGLPEILELLAGGRCWVKLSAPYRVSTQLPGYDGVTAIAQAMISANARRVVWGSDWPHTGPHSGPAQRAPSVIEFREIDCGALVDLIADWALTDSLRELLLVRNPEALYRF